MRFLTAKFKRLARVADKLLGPEIERIANVAPYVLVWSRDDKRLVELKRGEHRAVDVHCIGLSDEGVRWRCVERASRVDDDLGLLYDRGEPCGYVASIAGDVLRLEVTLQFDPAAVQPGKRRRRAAAAR
jgi:hypothetical protein